MHDDIAGRGGRRTVVPGVGQPAAVEFLDVAVGVIPVLIRQHMRPGLGDTGFPLILHNVAQQRLAAAPCVPAPALPQAVVLCHAVCLRNKHVFDNILSGQVLTLPCISTQGMPGLPCHSNRLAGRCGGKDNMMKWLGR